MFLKMFNFLLICFILQVVTSGIYAVSEKGIDPRDLVTINDRLYYFSTVRMRPGEALTLCEEFGLKVAGLETKTEVDAVWDGLEVYWTSGVFVGTVWIWSNTGRLVNMTDNWAPNEPTATDPLSQACIQLTNGKFADFPCNTNLPFVCEEDEFCALP
ncbi:hypothetical protein B566_EDAN011128 [Ephemera danica]|nr:hypothetical protein B566_EDAN011128 [Ephemera danica]